MPEAFRKDPEQYILNTQNTYNTSLQPQNPPLSANHSRIELQTPALIMRCLAIQSAHARPTLHTLHASPVATNLAEMSLWRRTRRKRLASGARIRERGLRQQSRDLVRRGHGRRFGLEQGMGWGFVGGIEVHRVFAGRGRGLFDGG